MFSKIQSFALVGLSGVKIDVEVDNDKRACYFKQARYGKYIRMALILKLLEVE